MLNTSQKARVACQLRDRVWALEQTAETIHHPDTTDEDLIESLQEDADRLKDLIKKITNKSI